MFLQTRHRKRKALSWSVAVQQCVHYLKLFWSLGHCPDDNSTAVGFYDEETYTLGGAWRVGGRGYGTFSYVWNGTFLQGNYSLYPLGTGYTLNEFIKELPPESNIPTVEV